MVVFQREDFDVEDLQICETVKICRSGDVGSISDLEGGGGHDASRAHFPLEKRGIFQK